MLTAPGINILGVAAIFGLFSWSWTGEIPEAHHHLFLLPFLPLILTIPVQFALYQKFVKPSSPSERWFAFLSVIIPVRVYLIREKKQAFRYWMLSTANSCGMSFLSFLFFLLVIMVIPDADFENQFLLLTVETILPACIWMSTMGMVASLLLWYLVISPNFSTSHCFPDFEALDQRTVSFPFYWNWKFFNIVMIEKMKSESKELVESITPSERELIFLYHVAASHIKEEPSKMATIQEAIGDTDLVPHMTFATLERVDNTIAAEASLQKNIKHAQLMIDVKDNFNPMKYAQAGFFYSHPRLTGLQVMITVLQISD